MFRPGPNQPPTGTDALRRGTAALRAAGIDDPALEAELLLRHVLGLDKSYFFLRLPDQLSHEQHRSFLKLLGERAAHKPAAYISGHREFYGLDFRVQPGVLIPRPETEMLVEQSLALAGDLRDRGKRVRIVDVGTGSGAIAIAVAKHAPEAEVLATDRSRDALVIAAYNARQMRFAGRVKFLEGDLLDPVHGQVDIVAANLPYIPSAAIESLAPEVKDWEPREALDGGADGLDAIRRLIACLPVRVRPGGAAVLEIGYDQGSAVLALTASLGCASTTIVKDLSGFDRVAVIKL